MLLSRVALVDRDGTLFDTCELNIRSFERAFLNLGLRIPPELSELIHDGAGWQEMRSRFNLHLSYDAERRLLENKKSIFIQNLHIVRINQILYSHLLEFKTWFLVSNASIESSQAIFDYFKISQRHLIKPPTKLDPKPSPELYDFTVLQTGFTKSEYLVFEDSERGLTAGLLAGLSVEKVVHFCSLNFVI